MSFTDIVVAAAVVVVLSPVLLLATRGKDMGVSMDKEMMSCSDEHVVVELQSVTTIVMNNLARDGIVGSGIGITSTVCKDRDDRRRLMNLPPLRQGLVQKDVGLPDRLQPLRR